MPTAKDEAFVTYPNVTVKESFKSKKGTPCCKVVWPGGKKLFTGDEISRLNVGDVVTITHNLPEKEGGFPENIEVDHAGAIDSADLGTTRRRKAA